MPVLKSSKKALRVAKRRRVENELLRKKIRTALKSLRTNSNAKTLQQAFSAIDKGARKNIFHKNRAARLKSQASKLVSAK